MSGDLAHFDAERTAEYQQRAHLFIPGYQTIHALTLALLQGVLGPEARLLVAGIGTGKEAEVLCQEPGWRLTGVDPSASMLRVCQAMVAERGMTERVELVEGQVSGLPETPLYDAATAILIWHFIPDDGAKLDFVQALARRLKPGGELVLVNHFSVLDYSDGPLHRTAWGHYAHHGGWGSLKEITEKIADRATRLHSVSQTRQAELLAQAGFGPPRPFFQALSFGGWLARKV